MKISVTGIGWFDPEGPGQGREGGFCLHRGTVLSVPRRRVFPKPYPHFGRMDVYSRLGVAAVALALRDADLEGWEERRPFGLISSTHYGCLTTDVNFYNTAKEGDGGLASPQLFAYTLSSTFVGEAAIRFGLTGPTYTINEQPLTGLESLKAALQMISLGETGTMIAGVCDLDRPDDFPLQDTGISGALFVVLEKVPVGPSYGEIALDGIRVLCNDAKIENLFSLAEILTTGTRQ